ncbi:hypothetical protein [Cohnella panacarvi]|uniref:hypothetical protein n=1 Tax=Cohnella panacarvi TaxID=400776 RepID=UPI00047BA7C1|nr:hypothetical protein [Cohnella panacarvi]
MKKYRALLLGDIRQLLTDPMLMSSLVGPLMLIIIARLGFPILSDWLVQDYDFLLDEYISFAAVFLLIVIPMLPGSMSGLLMLDERDENMVTYFGVTPLARAGYFRYRLLLPSLLTFLLSVLFILLSGITEIQPENIYTVILLVLEAPILALFLTAFAANKVEGLALSKASGLLFVGPVTAYFVPEPWTYLAVWVPTYWPAQSYLTGIAGHSLASVGWFVIGLVFHVVLLTKLFHVFLRRTD